MNQMLSKTNKMVEGGKMEEEKEKSDSTVKKNIIKLCSKLWSKQTELVMCGKQIFLSSSLVILFVEKSVLLLKSHT